jgi:hypothetical protein
VGFNVFRSGGERLNGRLIAAKSAGSASGAAYSYVDRSTRPGRAYTYRLQAVEADGTVWWAGFAAVRTPR